MSSSCKKRNQCREKRSICSTLWYSSQFWRHRFKFVTSICFRLIDLWLLISGIYCCLYRSCVVPFDNINVYLWINKTALKVYKQFYTQMFKNIPSWLIKSRFKCKKQQHQKKTFCNLCFIVVFFCNCRKKVPCYPVSM